MRTETGKLASGVCHGAGCVTCGVGIVGEGWATCSGRIWILGSCNGVSCSPRGLASSRSLVTCKSQPKVLPVR